jgi:hypothetical protein
MIHSTTIQTHSIGRTTRPLLNWWIKLRLAQPKWVPKIVILRVRTTCPLWPSSSLNNHRLCHTPSSTPATSSTPRCRPPLEIALQATACPWTLVTLVAVRYLKPTFKTTLRVVGVRFTSTCRRVETDDDLEARFHGPPTTSRSQMYVNTGMFSFFIYSFYWWFLRLIRYEDRCHVMQGGIATGNWAQTTRRFGSIFKFFPLLFFYSLISSFFFGLFVYYSHLDASTTTSTRLGHAQTTV